MIQLVRVLTDLKKWPPCSHMYYVTYKLHTWHTCVDAYMYLFSVFMRVNAYVLTWIHLYIQASFFRGKKRWGGGPEGGYTMIQLGPRGGRL